MRILTYNVHGCVGIDRLRSYSRIAEVIAALNPDIVALQELDVGRSRSQGVHQARIIASLLEMKFLFHPAIRIREEEYGDAILSKHPLQLVRAGPLPKFQRWLAVEARGALWVSVMIRNEEWHIINTHLGLGYKERRLQALALTGINWIGDVPLHTPLVLCGDLNSRPTSLVHQIFENKLQDVQKKPLERREPTFSTAYPFTTLDYIFISPEIRVERSSVIRTKLARVASDHFPVLAELSIKQS